MALRSPLSALARPQVHGALSRYLASHGRCDVSKPSTDTARPKKPVAPMSNAAPPCRAAAGERSRCTERRVCRSPAAPLAPPCPAPPPRPPWDCHHATLQKEKTPVAAAFISDACGENMDRVARRLQQAALHRRLEYEQEARGLDRCGSAPRDSTHAAGQRTPGGGFLHEYPRGDCNVREQHHYVDPCAHQPRCVLEVDRSPRDAAHLNEQPARDSHAPAEGRPEASRKLKDRIIETLNLNRSSDANCPKRPRKTKCNNPVRDRPTDTRGIHTSATYGRSRTPDTQNSINQSDDNAHSVKLDKLLEERQNYNKAGRGRFVPNCKTRKTRATGALDIPVPAGTENVRVRIELKSTGGKKLDESNARTTVDRHDSWLSLSRLRRRLASRVKEPALHCGDNGGPRHLANQSASPPCTPQNKPPPNPPPCALRNKQPPYAPISPKINHPAPHKSLDSNPHKTPPPLKSTSFDTHLLTAD
ncbi:hypothetical protein ACJJTC_018214 [Scirpophaga incertulas]